MSLGLALAGVKLAKTGYNYYSARKNRTPKFQNTAEGKLLKKRSQTGMYDPSMRRQIISRTGRRAGEAAYENKQDIKGYLTSRGMENSIAGQSLLNRPKRDWQQTIAETSENVNFANEESKINAETQYAQGMTQADATRRQERVGSQQALVGGIAETAGGYLQGRATEQQATQKQQALDIPPDVFSWGENKLFEWAAMYPDTERAQKIVDMWFTRN